MSIGVRDSDGVENSDDMACDSTVTGLGGCVACGEYRVALAGRGVQLEEVRATLASRDAQLDELVDVIDELESRLDFIECATGYRIAESSRYTLVPRNVLVPDPKPGKDDITMPDSASITIL